MNKKLFLWSGLFLLVATFAFVGARRVFSQNGTHKAFTAFEIEKRYDTSGVEGYEESRTYAVRPDGSSAWFATRRSPDGRPVIFGEIYDVPGQRVTVVDGFTESLTTTKLTSAELDFQEGVDHTCESSTEHSVVLGQDVAKVTNPISSTHPLETTKWNAPALNCYSLSRTDVKYVDGKPGPKTVRDVAFLIPGEPSAVLFTAPSTYVERSPTQVADEFERRFGRRPYSGIVQKRAEASYQARQ